MCSCEADAEEESEMYPKYKKLSTQKTKRKYRLSNTKCTSLYCDFV